MATSGSVTVKVTAYNNLVFTWSLVSQDIVANTSRVTWKMNLVADGASGVIVSTVKKAWTVVVDGTTYTGTATTGIGAGETKTLASGSTTIEHEADGTKTFAFSFKQVFKGLVFSGEAVSDKTGSGVGYLPTIARASQPSCITWPEHTQQVGNFGDTIAIHMNRKSSSFTHTVRYQFGQTTGTIATGVTTGTTWTIPVSLMNLIPNSTSGSGTIFVDTYNGTAIVGTKTCGFTATVPASVKPTVTLALEDVTGIDAIYGSPVQLLSRILVTASGKSAYSSPIQSYTITANGSTYTAAEITTDVLKTAGTSRVAVTVKDSRGRSGSTYYDMNVQDYVFPVASKLTVHRCDADGREDEQGDYVKATVSAAITSLNSKNTAAYTLRYKKSEATSWTSVTLTALAGTYAPTDQTHVFAADGNSSYDVEFIAQDSHGSASRSTSVSTAFTLMNWGSDGRSMGIGKVAEEPNTLQIGLDVEFLGKVRGTIFDAIWPVGSIYLAYNHVDPSTLFGGTWERITNAFLWAVDASGNIGQTGGEKTVTLTVDQLPSHSHGSVYSQHAEGTKNRAWYSTSGSSMAYGAVATGGGAAHNNMPPYIQVSVWRRTA